MTEKQIEVLFALMDAIEKAAEAESFESVKRLADAARDVLANMPVQ